MDADEDTDVDLSLILPSRQPSAVLLNRFERLVASDAADHFFLFPTFKETPMRAPTGFVMSVDRDKPFKLDCFCSELFTGTTIAEVKDFNESEFYIHHAARIAATKKLHADMQERDIYPDLVGNAKTGEDLQKWLPFIGRDDGYCGLYAGTVLDAKTQTYGRKWFIICYDGLSDSLLSDLEHYFIECEKQGKSFANVLLEDMVMLRVKNIARRNRRKRILEMAQTLELSVDVHNDVSCYRESEDEDFELLATDVWETETFITRLNKTEIQFYSDVACVSLCKGDVIVNRTLAQGPMLIVGPETNSSSHRSNRTWSAQNSQSSHESCGFLSRYPLAPAVGDSKYKNLQANVFIGGSKYDNDEKTAAILTDELTAVEFELGRNAVDFPRPVEFSPILVLV